MHLKKVIFRNFRCFKQLELDLHPRLTVLVAENGGGKTAVLDGIAAGLTPVLAYLSSASQRLSGPGILDTDFHVEEVKKNSWPQKSDFTQIELFSTTGLHWDKWRASTKGKKPETKIGQKDLADLGGVILESYKGGSPELLPVFSYYGARRGWLPIPQRLRGTKIDYLQPTSALVGTLEPLNDFKEMLNWFDLEETAELRANKGCPPDDWDESELLGAVRTVIESMLGGRYRNPHFNRQHKFVVDTRGKPEQLQVSQLSQGYQSMLALGMDFARRLALANRHLDHNNTQALPHMQDFMKFWEIEQYIPDFYSPPLLAPAIMLVDEIDLHLHPSWQQRVLGDLMRGFPCTQFIVTTHSPQVLTTLRTENIRMLEQNDDGEWHAKVPDFSPLAHEPGDALAEIMGTHPRPKIENVTEYIHAYEQLAKAGKADSPEAVAIKENLDKAGYEFNMADNALFRYLADKFKRTKQGR